MKNPHWVVLFAAAAVVSMTSAHAQTQSNVPTKMYAEIGYAALELKATDGADSAKASPGVLTGVFGYQLLPNLAVEGLVGLGAGKAGIEENGAPSGVDVKISSAFGVFLRPSVAVSDSIDLFARAGWLRTTLKISDGSSSESGSGIGFAYGLGANFNLSKTSYIQGNWMNYYKKNGVKVDGFGIAYGMRF